MPANREPTKSTPQFEINTQPIDNKYAHFFNPNFAARNQRYLEKYSQASGYAYLTQIGNTPIHNPRLSLSGIPNIGRLDDLLSKAAEYEKRIITGYQLHPDTSLKSTDLQEKVAHDLILTLIHHKEVKKDAFLRTYKDLGEKFDPKTVDTAWKVVENYLINGLGSKR